MTTTAETGTVWGLGAFAFPQGLLLVEGHDDVRADLAAGILPLVWPEGLRAHALAHAGELLAASAACAGDDPVSAYNRWVLDPETADPATIRAGLPAELAPLVDVVAYSTGQGVLPAMPPPMAASEVTALVWAALATERLESGDGGTAIDLLDRAARAAAPAAGLAGVLRGHHGTLLREAGQRDEARASLSEATALLAGSSDLRESRAELLHHLGSLSHEDAASGRGDARALLHEAMRCYYDALQLVTEESSPQLWAGLQLDLATAHLATPMTTASDQLRLGVATQALRACRRVFTPEAAPETWSTATLNLANALVYTPSTHQGDNLVEAVELYEEILVSGIRQSDPSAMARLLANQGNVLAHLGIPDQAKAKLVEARYLFETQLDHESVMAVRGVLDEIAKAGVEDPDESLTDLVRQADRLGRMPQPETFTSGMGVRTQSAALGIDAVTPPKPRVTVLRPGQDRP
ncbi:MULTISPECIES: hypothetical protein [Nocardioides]|uniref:hypothetical protein n=1 Tax=Nocardioides TaxID=1839 RepID=UPI0003300430|nr:MULTISPECIES: hypothetical protein [Nocardioides]EON22103.1 TPR repeat-containing protein [Nocardioides sp. CF8]